MSSSIETYLNFFQTRYSLDLSVYDDSFLLNIINDRSRELALVNDTEYLNFLESRVDEVVIFRSRLTNSYSEFFRNPITFAYLEQVVLPQLIEKKKIGKENEIRIWSAACASGQEAYSMAILCDELIKCSSAELTCRIFATDISPEALNLAQSGNYQSLSLSKVTLKRIETYFTRKDENYSIVQKIKSYIDFSVFDLLSEKESCPPASIYGNFDLVLCSNLLFYYKPDYRNCIIEKIGNSLANGGYIISGETEREILSENNFREIILNSAIFQKRR